MSPEIKARFRIDLKTVIAAVSLAVGAASFLARSVAQAEIEPVKIEAASVSTRLESLERKVKQQNKKLDALCRAIPRADCPLGDE